MKRQITTLCISIFLLTACNSENAAVSSADSMRSPAMENFDRALKSLGDSGNKMNEEEKKSGSTELSDRRKRILLPSAIDLIKSTGINERTIEQKTNGDVSAILVWAIQINQEKNSQMRANLKTQN